MASKIPSPFLASIVISTAVIDKSLSLMMPLSLAMQTIRRIKSHERSPMDYFFSAQRTRPKSAGGQAQACAAKGIGFQTAPFGGLDFFWRGSPALAPPRWEGCIFGSRQRARSQGQANASAVKVSPVRAESKPKKKARRG